MQGLGILVSSAVTMAVCVAFKRSGGGLEVDAAAPTEADLAWRLILMIGALPAALTFYWRMLMPETARSVHSFHPFVFLYILPMTNQKGRNAQRMVLKTLKSLFVPH